ncbi:hypothetical protein EDC04DRAFT_2906234 [Pisolithus marmoratus]|nr:hypothetical protein EDC04DRAFT_2906234 [Pisolithus marmoratus]
MRLIGLYPGASKLGEEFIREDLYDLIRAQRKTDFETEEDLGEYLHRYKVIAQYLYSKGKITPGNYDSYILEGLNPDLKDQFKTVRSRAMRTREVQPLRSNEVTRVWWDLTQKQLQVQVEVKGQRVLSYQDKGTHQFMSDVQGSSLASALAASSAQIKVTLTDDESEAEYGFAVVKEEVLSMQVSSMEHKVMRAQSYQGSSMPLSFIEVEPTGQVMIKGILDNGLQVVTLRKETVEIVQLPVDKKCCDKTEK